MEESREVEAGVLCDDNTERELQKIEEEIRMVENKTHPKYLEWLAECNRRDKEQKERDAIRFQLRAERIEYEYQQRKKQIDEEFEREKQELVESMLKEIDEQIRKVENEYCGMDIVKPNTNQTMTDANKKTLRGRGGGILIEPPTYFNATPKPVVYDAPVIKYLLTDAQIAEDIQAICGYQSSPSKTRLFEVTMSKQKLIYDGKSYKQGEEVYMENKSYGKIPAKLESITENVVAFKSTLPYDIRQVFASYSDFTEGRVLVSKKRNN